MHPKIGDVLVSRSLAANEHAICVVPKPAHMVKTNHETAVARAVELAESLHVDAWLTEDHIHFLKLASNRPAPAARC